MTQSSGDIDADEKNIDALFANQPMTKLRNIILYTVPYIDFFHINNFYIIKFQV